MDRKKIAIILISITVIIIAFIIFILLRPTLLAKKVKSHISPSPKVTMLKEEFKEYTSDAGFKFKISRDLAIKKKETDDKSIYTVLNISSDKIKGGISIIISDSKLKNTDQFIKENKIAPTESTISETNLDDLKANKIATKKGAYIVSIDQGILYEIKVDYGKNKDFWDESSKKMVASFQFVKEEKVESIEGSGSSDSSDQGTFEEEETVE